ncbi:hypothetical protein [Anoxybacteroides amylolyticum]|uniref:Uncharacterized protein n=1 Tax=Anoxybacteroides amylolyticum TaxID=294699 RepID=A0A160F1H7_9BACL|nr:hypothetical protein [Anoxybacillus amylolyticus]ANB59988.1 hypothetical protein GFC30_2756 [Anoxybacillus amylolyticus]
MKWLAFILTLIIAFLSHHDENPSPYYIQHETDMKVTSLSKIRKQMIQEWREAYGVPFASEIER